MALYTSKNHLSFIFLSDVFKVQTSRTSWFKRKEKFLLGFAWLILLLHLIRRCGDQNNNQMRKQSKNTIFIILGDFTITWASLTLQSKNVWHKNDLKLEMWNLLELIVASVPQDFHYIVIVTLYFRRKNHFPLIYTFLYTCMLLPDLICNVFVFIQSIYTCIWIYTETLWTLTASKIWEC